MIARRWSVLAGVVLTLLIVPMVSRAAVTLDAVTPAGTTAGATSLTFAHTVGSSCTNPVLYVLFGNDAGTDIVTGVTYNALTLTRVDVALVASGGFAGYYYRRINPPKGSAFDVVVSQSAAEGIAATAISVCGADQTTPERGIAQDISTSTSWTTPVVTSSVDDLVIALVAVAASTTSATYTVPATPRSDVSATGSQTCRASTGTSPGAAGTVSMSGTFSTSTAHAMMIVSVQPPVAAARTRRTIVITP